MMLTVTMLGISLIVIGVLVFVYQGFTYANQQKVAKVGDIKLTAGIQKAVSLSPIIGGITLAAGIVLVILGSL